MQGLLIIHYPVKREREREKETEKDREGEREQQIINLNEIDTPLIEVKRAI